MTIRRSDVRLCIGFHFRPRHGAAVAAATESRANSDDHDARVCHSSTTVELLIRFVSPANILPKHFQLPTRFLSYRFSTDHEEHPPFPRINLLRRSAITCPLSTHRINRSFPRVYRCRSPSMSIVLSFHRLSCIVTPLVAFCTENAAPHLPPSR